MMYIIVKIAIYLSIANTNIICEFQRVLLLWGKTHHIISSQLQHVEYVASRYLLYYYIPDQFRLGQTKKDFTQLYQQVNI